MFRYANYQICIFMNINENIKNKRKLEKNQRDVYANLSTFQLLTILYYQPWYQFNANTLWKGFPDETLCVQFSFCFLRLQFYFVNYVIVSCELPYYNSFGQRMLLKN